MGTPNIGRRQELAQDAPQAEVLGVVKDTVTAPGPQAPSASWTNADGVTVDMNEAPPPWELGATDHDESDARRYVSVPSNWTLRWINPKLLESMGWRYWQPVMASDPRVKCLVSQMVGPDNNIRRGGTTGDILGWMYTSWVESRRKEHVAKTQRLADSAVNKQEELRDEFKRGTFGPYVHLSEAVHPRYTNADGRSMRDP